MPSKTVGKYVSLVGCLLMAHAAFAMVQFRHFVRATGDELVSTPLDIIIEALLALVVCTVGAAWWAGSFKKILAAPTLWARRYDSYSSVEDFQTFHHRGLAFNQWRLHGNDAATTTQRGEKAVEQKHD